MHPVKGFARRVRRATGRVLGLITTYGLGNQAYWNTVNVTHHQAFATAQESLDYFAWRNDQYVGYIELMPVNGKDGQVVLDYGCGPGNDLVGFGHFSKPARLIGADIANRSLDEAKRRLSVHGINAEFVKISEHDNRVPLEDGAVDYIHSSGVVHHAQDPAAVLREFRRVIRPTGKCRIMVYHYDSLWVHLYVAYVRQILEMRDANLDLRSAFTKSTDGENCPIARVYEPAEFVTLAEESGFRCRFLGAAISIHELKILAHRFAAIEHPHLAAEHRRFLIDLTFDERALPRYRGHLAGIDGCYELTPV